jgi:hypothetical protein
MPSPSDIKSFQEFTNTELRQQDAKKCNTQDRLGLPPDVKGICSLKVMI